MRCVPLVLALVLALCSPAADAAFVSYNFAGTTTGANPLAVLGFIDFNTDTAIASSTATTTVYSPASEPLLASILINGTFYDYFANTYDSSDFISVTHSTVGDAFRFDIAGFALTLSNTTGNNLPNTSLATAFNQSLFSNLSLVATAGGQQYNVAITQFTNAAPEPSSLLMTSMAGAGLMLVRRLRGQG